MRLYLVGGCVRDLLLRVSLRDLDLVVEGDAPALGAAVARALDAKVTATSLFGTCRIEGGGLPKIDLAMSRRERYAEPAALPQVSPAPIETDLLRRDLTINSLALALNGPRRGEVLDPSGGAADLSARLARFHHRRSLADDPTRAFRAARYAVRFRLRLAPSWCEAIAAADRARSFDRLTPARIRREIALIWREKDPRAVLGWCSSRSLLRRVHPALRWSPSRSAAFLRASRARGERGAEATLDLWWSLLAWSSAPAARASFLRRIGVSGRAAERILAAAGAPDLASRLAKERGRDRIGMLGPWPPLAVLLVEAAGSPAARRFVARQELLRRRGRPLLRGSDLMSLGVPRGPAVGEILRALAQARAAGRVATRVDEVRFVRRRMAGGASP